MGRRKMSLKGIKTYADLKAAIAKRDARSAQSRADHFRKLAEEKKARKSHSQGRHVNPRVPIVRTKKAGVPAAHFVSGGRVESNRKG
jgi:hypothetical protein